ncbi:MAG: cohesin domain-containing protein [Patescibacteria group bacterium]|jgi:hypothetical protein
MKKIFFIFIIIAGLGVWFWPSQSEAASLLLSPTSASLQVGQSKIISIIVASSDQAMNASQAVLSFPTSKLQVTGLSKAGLFSYWTQEPSYSNSSGTITFGGGMPTPGYKGSGRSIFSITFKAKATGTAKITYTSGSVFANDGEGTNIIKSYGSSTLTISAATPVNTAPEPEPTPQPNQPSIVAPSVTSTTHPNSDSWYNKPDISLTWTRPNNNFGVSYILDQVATTTPDEALETNTGSEDFKQTADGVWYFHIRAKYSTGWSNTTHFKIQIDTRPPENFSPQISREGGTGNPNVILIFSTTDSLSGVSGYAIAYDANNFVTVTSPYTLKNQKAGLHQYTVRATDRAGNSRDAIGQFNVEGSPAPRITQVPKTVTLFGEIPVEGLTVKGDEVVLLVDGKEVGRFISDNYQIDSKNGVAVPEGLVLWRYVIQPFLIPGDHQLTAYAINQFKIESPASVPVLFKTLGSVTQIFGFYVSTWGLIISLLLVIFILILLLLILYERYRHWRRQQAFDLDKAEEEINEEIEKLQTVLEKDIAGAIRSSIKEKSIQSATHDQIKKDLIQTRSRIDGLLEKEIQRKKRKRK